MTEGFGRNEDCADTFFRGVAGMGGNSINERFQVNLAWSAGDNAADILAGVKNNGMSWGPPFLSPSTFAPPPPPFFSKGVFPPGPPPRRPW